MMNRYRVLAALVPFAFALACTDAAKLPAEAAMKAAESAAGELKGEVAKFAPDQVKAVQDALAAAKDKLSKEDYKGALEAAGAIPAAAKAALAAAAARKAELMKAWGEVSSSLPNMVGAIKSRLGILAKAKKLPAGLDKGALAKANEGVAAIESGLAKATEQVKAGGIGEAIAQAQQLKAKGAEIMKSIGMAQ